MRRTTSLLLVLDQHGFGHHEAGAAGAGKASDCHQQMQKEDGQIAHRAILQDCGTRKNF